MLDQLSPNPLAAAACTTAAKPPSRGFTLPRDHVVAEPSIRMLRGRDAILAAGPQLAALAAASGQTGEADSLEYFLSTPDAVRKIPHLLLIDDARNSASSPAAAVRLFEYRTVLGPTRVFATDDGAGRRNVLAPPELRAYYAALAARTLIERGAHIVQISFSDAHRDRSDTSPAVERRSIGSALQAVTAELRGCAGTGAARRPFAQWSLYEQDLPAYLPLLPTFDATLARIGQKTRANLRYYRRRCELELGSTFVAQAEIGLAEFLAFNRECSFAVEDRLAAFRHRMLTTQPCYLLRGVRDRNGRWLSLAGIRRQNGFVEIDWQMNRADLPHASLATVLRSYLLQHEIALGSTRLYIEGGTGQPIGRSFLSQRVAELTVKRDSRYVRLLERFASEVFPPKNYIGHTLHNPHLNWRPW